MPGGRGDPHSAPEHVKQLAEVLEQHGKDFEFHSYEGGGHGFLSPDHPSYHVEVANEGSKRISRSLVATWVREKGLTPWAPTSR